MSLDEVRADYPWIDKKYITFHQRLLEIGERVDPSSGLARLSGINPGWLKVIGDTEFTDRRVAVMYEFNAAPRYVFTKTRSTVGNEIYVIGDNNQVCTYPKSTRLNGYLEHEQAFWTVGEGGGYGILLRDVAYSLYVGNATLSLCARD